MWGKRICCSARAVIVATMLIAVRSAADPVPVLAPVPVPTHLASASAVHTDGGSDLRLPPGYFLPEPLWTKLNTETKRLQDTETRLAAENKSLRASTAGWQPGWYVTAAAIGTGLVSGWYLHSKL